MIRNIGIQSLNRRNYLHPLSHSHSQTSYGSVIRILPLAGNAATWNGKDSQSHAHGLVVCGSLSSSSSGSSSSSPSSSSSSIDSGSGDSDALYAAGGSRGRRPQGSQPPKPPQPQHTSKTQPTITQQQQQQQLQPRQQATQPSPSPSSARQTQSPPHAQAAAQARTIQPSPSTQSQASKAQAQPQAPQQRQQQQQQELSRRVELSTAKSTPSPSATTQQTQPRAEARSAEQVQATTSPQHSAKPATSPSETSAPASPPSPPPPTTPSLSSASSRKPPLPPSSSQAKATPKPVRRSPVSTILATTIAILVSAVSLHADSRAYVLSVLSDSTRATIESYLPKPLFGADGQIVSEKDREKQEQTHAKKAGQPTTTPTPSRAQPQGRPSTAGDGQQAPAVLPQAPPKRLSSEERAGLQRARDESNERDRAILQQLLGSLEELQRLDSDAQRQQHERAIQRINELERQRAENREQQEAAERQYAEEQQRKREQHEREQFLLHQRLVEEESRRHNEARQDQRKQQQQEGGGAEKRSRWSQLWGRRAPPPPPEVNIPAPPERFDSLEDAERYLQKLKREVEILGDQKNTIKDAVDDFDKYLQWDYMNEYGKKVDELLSKYDGYKNELINRQLDEYESELKELQNHVVQNVDRREYKRFMRTLKDELNKLEDDYTATRNFLLGEQQRVMEYEAAVERQKRLEALQKLTSKVKAYSKVFAQQEAYDLVSSKVHCLALTLLAMEHLLNEHRGNFQDEWYALKESGQGDSVIESVVESIDPAIIQHGVMSADELISSFKDVEKNSRDLLFLPDDENARQGVIANGLARLARLLSIREPAYASSEWVYDDHARLDKAWRSIEKKGDLQSAVDALESIKDPRIREAAADWLYHARQRLALEQGVQLVKNRVTELANAFVAQPEETDKDLQQQAKKIVQEKQPK